MLFAWKPIGTTDHHYINAEAIQKGAPEKHLYLADGTNWIRNVTKLLRYLDYNGEYQGLSS